MLPIRRTDAVPPLAVSPSVYRWYGEKLDLGADNPAGPAPGAFYEASICAASYFLPSLLVALSGHLTRT